MSTDHRVSIWHEEAMDLAEMAIFAKRRGELYNYWKLIQRALNYEKAAAKLLVDNFKTEPSRGVLYKGACYLALNLDHFEEAKQLLNEALEGNPPSEVREELVVLLEEINKREQIRSRALVIAQSVLESEAELSKELIQHAVETSIFGVKGKFVGEDIDSLLNRIALEVSLESKNLVDNPDYQIFEDQLFDKSWLEKKNRSSWSFWKAYKVYLDKKKFASTTIQKLDLLTDDILSRIGDPFQGGVWQKRGMIVGDVQSGKTSNYIGLINKAADLGFRIVIVLTGLYESLRQQTQERIDEGFVGRISDLNNANSGAPFGVELYRKPSDLPVHPITRAGVSGDLSKGNLPNHPIKTNDYYAIVVKKNPSVLKALLNWLHARGEWDGEYKLIKNIPLLVIDDEADYASLNVDKDFVSKINGSIRAILSLFQQSAFVGYTATPFANVFISDHNDTEGKEIYIGDKKFRLGEDLFPKDFIINLAAPSNYIGYSKVFNASLNLKEDDYTEGDLPMLNLIDDNEDHIPKGHRKQDDLPNSIPASLEYAIKCFFIVSAVRLARGQSKEHNSMLIHVSWYVQWIDKIAFLVNKYSDVLKQRIKANDEATLADLKYIWENEYAARFNKILDQLKYDDPQLILHDWNEIASHIVKASDKIEVRSMHGSKKNLEFLNIEPLNYSENKSGLSIIAVGGNKLSRGLTLEGLSVSYFLRATRFYDTLLQMGRWFGYRPGYLDLCRLFTTEEIAIWYQYIANATEELKEQFDIMDLAERTPKSFGLKVRSAPGMLMISSAAKIKGATDLSLSYSGDLQETYFLSKSKDILGGNLRALNDFIERLGPHSKVVRQGQNYIWEGVSYSNVDNFIADYRTNQASIRSNFIRGYIGQQLKKGHLNNWTIVLIDNSTAGESYKLTTSHTEFNIGYTFRKEAEEVDAYGSVFVNPKNYIIRKSHIISPPHEYLDIDENDKRFLSALKETQERSKSKNPIGKPAGKFIRKYRGPENVLLIIYVLDPKGFGGIPSLPAIGYAISFPEIVGDEKIPYKVNRQFIEELFSVPADAEENPETEEED